MYLTHHLGLGDAVHFIQNTIPEEDVFIEGKNGNKRLKQNGAKKLLTAQVGKVAAEAKFVHPNGGDWVMAHRSWLQGFIGSHITPSNVACAGEFRKKLERQESRGELLSITDTLKQ